MALSLQAVAVLDFFLFFSTKERELPAGAAQGAVSPAEAQQRLYHRELSRLLELLHVPLKSFKHQLNLSTMPSKCYVPLFKAWRAKR